MLTLTSWNIRGSDECWRQLAASSTDVAILQEAKAPPPDVAHLVKVDESPWKTGPADANRNWRTAIARISSRARIRPIPIVLLSEADGWGLRISLPGTLAVAEVVVEATGEQFTAVSMYGVWERPCAATGSRWIYADAAVHRLVSDLSVLIGRQRGHKILAAGDLNILSCSSITFSAHTLDPTR
jgi:hypothetical protein